MRNKYEKPIRIGMICPFWLPRHGGGEQYDHRLALELIRQGFDVHVFTGTSAQESKDNGSLDVSRYVSRGDAVHSSWRMVYRDPRTPSLKSLTNHYALMDEAVQWCIQHNIQIAFISNPWQQTELAHARELYLQLKMLGIKTGLIHFDLAPQIERALIKTYQHTKSWEISKKVVQMSTQKVYRTNHPLHALHMIGSPLFFQPDFVLSCSDWSSAFIDPEASTPKIVLHPILDRQHWTDLPNNQEILSHKDVLMINPLGRKGPKLMADLIKSDQCDLSFRVLKGGWGDSFKSFVPTINESTAYQHNRVELLEYVLDIRQAYRSAGLIFFPSLYEGYGMAAVEPMFAGTPVVSSNHPAIMEAVGSGALTLCPYHDTSERWASAVNEVLNKRDYWAERARQRSQELDDRQTAEMKQLSAFLTQLVS